MSVRDDAARADLGSSSTAAAARRLIDWRGSPGGSGGCCASRRSPSARCGSPSSARSPGASSRTSAQCSARRASVTPPRGLRPPNASAPAAPLAIWTARSFASPGALSATARRSTGGRSPTSWRSLASAAPSPSSTPPAPLHSRDRRLSETEQQQLADEAGRISRWPIHNRLSPGRVVLARRLADRDGVSASSPPSSTPPSLIAELAERDASRGVALVGSPATCSPAPGRSAAPWAKSLRLRPPRRRRLSRARRRPARLRRGNRRFATRRRRDAARSRPRSAPHALGALCVAVADLVAAHCREHQHALALRGAVRGAHVDGRVGCRWPTAPRSASAWTRPSPVPPGRSARSRC